ncbi:MAG: M28 family peptidase [Planctomycetota bacterium]
METTPRKPDRQTLFLVIALICGTTAAAFLWLRGDPGVVQAERTRTRGTNPFDGERAYQHLLSICSFGPRVSGSPGMQAQQDYLARHFEELGGKVSWQRWTVRHPQTGEPVPLVNMIVEWHPERTERVLLCAHYDTRPYPDQDPDPARRRDPFLGANDGASGCAVLAEMAEHMSSFDSQVGVDFVLFDAEELVYDDERDDYFLGSTYFAQNYVQNPPAHRYRWGVLLDMVGDANLQIYQEVNSVRWRDTRPLVNAIWRTARRIGIREFIPQKRYEIRDDHLPLRNIAKIPTCDIIDFDYGPTSRGNPYWHTTQDTPDKCSGESLGKVGWVVLEWLSSL